MKRYRGTIPVEPKATPEEEEDLAYKELKAAKKRFEDAVHNKRNKTTNRQELTSAGKTILKGAGRMVDDFLDGSSRIGDSIERDIRRHSIQGQIDNTIIRALMEKNKSSKGKGTSKRPTVYIEVKGIDGRPALVDIRTIPAALRRKGR
jgi:hypothetical protein